MKAWMLNVWTHDILQIPNSVYVNIYVSEIVLQIPLFFFSVVVKYCDHEKTKQNRFIDSFYV